jgi:hypothetical protein
LKTGQLQGSSESGRVKKLVESGKVHPVAKGKGFCYSCEVAVRQWRSWATTFKGWQAKKSEFVGPDEAARTSPGPVGNPAENNPLQDPGSDPREPEWLWQRVLVDH